MGLLQNKNIVLIWISGKITKVSEIMPITNGVLIMMFSLGAMFTLSKISQIRKIVKTMDFQGSRFHGNNIHKCASLLKCFNSALIP